MLRGAGGITKLTKMGGPSKYATRGYASNVNTIENAKSLAKRILTGTKPRFPSPAVQKIADPKLRKIETFKEYADYVKFVDNVGEAAKEVALDVAKDQAKKFAGLMLSAVMALIVMIASADDDLEKMRKEIEDEKANLQDQIKKLEDDEEIKKAALAELEKSYVSWMDWWNDTTGAAKLEVKTTLSEIVAAQKLLQEQISGKETALENIKTILQIRGQEREELILNLT